MLQRCRDVDEFERLHKINEGTYGIVYKAKEKATGRIVALKKVPLGSRILLTFRVAGAACPSCVFLALGFVPAPVEQPASKRFSCRLVRFNTRNRYPWHTVRAFAFASQRLCKLLQCSQIKA